MLRERGRDYCDTPTLLDVMVCPTVRKERMFLYNYHRYYEMKKVYSVLERKKDGSRCHERQHALSTLGQEYRNDHHNMYVSTTGVLIPPI
jgi:hypothetical protein